MALLNESILSSIFLNSSSSFWIIFILAFSSWIFDNLSKKASVIIEDTFTMLHDFQSLHKNVGGAISKIPRKDPVWQVPSPWSYKINVNTATCDSSNCLAIKAVVQDEYGVVVGGFSKKLQVGSSAIMGECLAIREALSFAFMNGWIISSIETDASTVVSAISKNQVTGLLGLVIFDTCNLLKQANCICVCVCVCIWIPRCCNEVAHDLTRFGLSNS